MAKNSRAVRDRQETPMELKQETDVALSMCGGRFRPLGGIVPETASGLHSKC